MHYQIDISHDLKNPSWCSNDFPSLQSDVQESSMIESLMPVKLAMDEIHINLYAWFVDSLIRKYAQMLNERMKAKMFDEDMNHIIDVIIWISMDAQISV
jgi:hypothetical protein